MGKFFYTPEIEKLKAKRDVEGLIKALKDENEDAALALGEIKDGRAVEPLIEALSHKAHKAPPAGEDRFAGIRMSAADALGEIGDKRAIEPLARACHDRNKYVRYYVVIALSRFKDDEGALKALEEVLREDPEPDHRRIAAIALGKIR